MLIVEDDDDKADILARFIRDTYNINQIDVARSLQSGLRSSLAATHDLILLDMAMRNFDRTLEDDGGRPHQFAGREILRQLKRANVETSVIVVTHFERFGEDAEMMTLEELTQELSDKFVNYKGTVQFKSNVDAWRTRMKQIIDEGGLL